MEEDFILKTIKEYYLKFKNYNFESIKKFIGSKNLVHMEDSVLSKRIEKVKNEINRSIKN